MSVRILLNLILISLIQVSFAKADSTRIKIEGPEGLIALISSTETDSWDLSKGNDTWKLTKKSSDDVVFQKNNITLCSGRFKGTKLLMGTGNGSLFMAVNLKPEKLKFYWNRSDREWEFKQKSDKIKIVYDDFEKGKIKFYKDSGKLKAKNNYGDTLAVATGHDKLSAFPGVYAVKDLPEDNAVFLMLLILSMGL
jgi:hypothetical protein